ncbi:MAG: transposase, partial [Pseudonocardiaceae bacterium]
MAAFLHRHAYRGGKTPPDSHPRCWPAYWLLLRTLQGTITALETEIKRIIAIHPRARLLQQLPGIDQINLAQILAEIGPILDRVEDAEQATAECGTTPVTKSSGKTTGVYFRWATNTRARKAITAFAHNSRMQSPWAQGLYRDARARGKRNPHANRIVARSWIRVIWTCWHTNTPDDPPQTHRRTTRCHPDLTQRTQTRHRPRQTPPRHTQDPPLQDPLPNLRHCGHREQAREGGVD